MDCNYCKERISLYLADALTQAEVDALQAHIAVCPDCAREEQEMREMIFALAALNEDVEAPAELMEGVMREIEKEPGVKSGRSKKNPASRRFGGLKLAGFAVAGVAVLALTGTLLLGGLFGLVSPKTAPQRASGGSASSESPMASIAPSDVPMDAGTSYDMDMMEEPAAAMEDPAAMMEELGLAGGSAPTDAADANTAEEYGVKVIKSAMLNIETDHFDADLEQINALLAQYGGFVTSQDSSGLKLDEDQYGSGRSLNMQLRVPQGHLEAFITGASLIGVVRYSSIYHQDITSQYYDTRRRLQGYQTQHDRILELMAKATTVEELITIEAELTRLNYEIDALTGNLKYWDSQVDYSTVQLNMQEVKRAESLTPTLSERMSNALATTFDNIVNGSKSFVVWLYGSLPYIGIVLVLGGAVAVPVGITLRKRKKAKKSD